MAKAVCPVCGRTLTLSLLAKPGEGFRCPSCYVELRIESLEPLRLEPVGNQVDDLSRLEDQVGRRWR